MADRAKNDEKHGRGFSERVARAAIILDEAAIDENKRWRMVKLLVGKPSVAKIAAITAVSPTLGSYVAGRYAYEAITGKLTSDKPIPTANRFPFIEAMRSFANRQKTKPPHKQWAQ
jgi:hypothetical protein